MFTKVQNIELDKEDQRKAITVNYLVDFLLVTPTSMYRCFPFPGIFLYGQSWDCTVCRPDSVI